MSKGGTMVLRDGRDLSILLTRRLENNTVAHKDLWVTDVVLLQNTNQVFSETFLHLIAAEPDNDSLWVIHRNDYELLTDK